MHMDEVERVAGIREKELERERKELYRKGLDEQLEMRSRRFGRGGTEEDRKIFEEQMNRAKQQEANELLKQQQNKMLAINIMDENLRARRRAEEELREAQAKQDEALLANMRRNHEAEQQRLELERRSKQKRVNDLIDSYNQQEALKKEQERKLRELDRVYSDQYKERLLNEEKDHQRVRVW